MSNNANIEATRAHVDAETMAAWADRALPAEEAAAVELHLSNCDRCQEVLAALVRSAPLTGAVVIPFWARRPVQWSAAGLAAAAALVAMIWIGRPPAALDPESTVASRSVAAETPVTAPAELRRDTPASAEALRQDKPASTPVELKKEQPSSLSAREERRRDSQTRDLDERAAANQAAAKKTEGRAAGLASVPPPPVPVAAPPAPPPSALAQVALAPPPVTVTAAAPVVTPVGAVRPAAVSESLAMDALTAIPIIEITAPDPNPSALRSQGGAGRGAATALSRSSAPTRWRVVAGTHIERSLDSGATWTLLPIEPALTTALRAGVATSQTNCWFVGRGGVVLVTSDGSTFRRVSVPEAVQLISVIATDALRATVTAIDGRKFATIDGGLTWK